MVKNLYGGKHKGQARKNVMSNRRGPSALRLATVDGEIYAQVLKVLGGSNCHVICIDGVTRLCHIRGKFRGRSHRDNMISVGTWVMIGTRDYESVKGTTKLQNCDLLEVYGDADKERLKTSVKLDWTIFVTNDDTRNNLSKETPDVNFITDEDQEIQDMILLATAGGGGGGGGDEESHSQTAANTVVGGSEIEFMVDGDDDEDVGVDDI